jgi:pyruvate/2-oxoglutarate dehydrogenase complex dihydrolipoamide dehydrogenase (E3) component
MSSTQNILIIGGSDAGISAALRAKELDHKVYYPGAKKLYIRMTGDRKTHRLLGAQLVGAYGTEVSKRIDIVAAAIYQKIKVEDLNNLDLSYTPPLSSPWDPVQMASQRWLQNVQELA